MQNLWPELNNAQSSSGSDGQVQEPPRRRRLTEQVVLSSLRDWLLHDYVVPYCRTLSASRIYRRCYWIDALGNINSRANSNILQHIVSLAGELDQEGTATTLHGIVLEAGSSKRKATTPTINRAPTINRGATAEGEQSGNNHVASSTKAGRSPIYRGTLPQRESGIVRASWLEIAPALLDLIGQSPAIFLLNPFGHTLFTYDDLAPLYQRTAPTELCLLISHKQVMAHLTGAHLASTPLAPARGGPTINRGPTLTALLRSDRWKALPTDGEAMERTIDGVIDLLIASMQRHFLSVQRIALPVQIRPTVVETAPYTLIFATRRQDSLANMNDAVCLYRRRLHEQSRRGVLAEEWFAAQQQERFTEELQQLYRRMLQHGRAQRVRRWPDLRQQLLNADFGRYTVHEYDEVMQQLLASGDVRCEWRRRPAEARKSEKGTIPGNEDILLFAAPDRNSPP
ncbi:MAG TPA: hypothetical protein VFN02_09005 [Ktedonobacteraceae bacterium]|nr:hypothetical protein [Ktedonobacteraceae bacterium]